MSALAEIFAAPIQSPGDGPIIGDVLSQRLAWTSYRGKRGGKGWQDSESGEIRYQVDKPGEKGEKSADSQVEQVPPHPTMEIERGRKPANARQNIVIMPDNAHWLYAFREPFSGEAPASAVKPEEVDLQFEQLAMESALEESRAFWSSSDPDALMIRRLDGDYDEAVDVSKAKVGIMTVMTFDPSSYGMGSGGTGSAKVFWGPYSAPDRDLRLTTQNDYKMGDQLGVDPMYVTAHELHHAWGSESEFDFGSDVVAICAHIRSGLQHHPVPAARQLGSFISSALVGEGKNRRKRYARTFRYIYRRFGEGVDSLMTRVPAWAGSPCYSPEEWPAIKEKVLAEAA